MEKYVNRLKLIRQRNRLPTHGKPLTPKPIIKPVILEKKTKSDQMTNIEVDLRKTVDENKRLPQTEITEQQQETAEEILELNARIYALELFLIRHGRIGARR